MLNGLELYAEWKIPTLEDFEVVEICIFGVDIELDSAHWKILLSCLSAEMPMNAVVNGIHLTVNAIVYLTQCCSGIALNVNTRNVPMIYSRGLTQCHTAQLWSPSVGEGH